jgi:uncharacterized protein (UPF0303 family)
MNNIEEDLQRIALQEERLQFDHFDAQTAWELGSQLRQVAEERQLAIVIDIQLHGLPLFYFARQGTTPDNPEWVRRKRNVVRRFFRSSYAIGLMVKSEKLSLDALDARDYAHHGGSFPIFLKGTGCVGTITVSGLPQREDHSLVVEIVAAYLQKDISDLSLSGGL